MSEELNYKRAWTQFLQPEFNKIIKNSKLHNAYTLSIKEVDKILQDGGVVIGQSKELTKLFNLIPIKELAWAEQVVYYYGHFASNGQIQASGLYWKFKKLAAMSLISRKGTSELRGKAKMRMSKYLDTFIEHVEGTKYTTDEIPKYILSKNPNVGKDLISIYKADTINHKPDIFCIGTRHFPKVGMYIDPKLAPCYNCKEPYSNHTYDTVLFLKSKVSEKELKAKNEELKEILQEITDMCKGKITLDGFIFVESDNE